MADYPETGAEASSAAANKAEKTEPDAKLASYWREISRYDKATEQWKLDGEKIVDMYLAESTFQSTTRTFPLLWANVETLKPATYAKMPVAQCSRRYKDRDPHGRIGAEILERCANTTFDLYGIDEILRMVRDDRLLPGRGQAWVRYEPTFETVKEEAKPAAEATSANPSDASASTADGHDPRRDDVAVSHQLPTRAQTQTMGSYERLAGEKACVDYVHWCDFGHSLARTWKDVRMVWRRVYWTREKCEKRFGKKTADGLTYDQKAPDDKDESGYKACIYEIWDKDEGITLWIAKEHPKILEEGAPPLQFMHFFPCPEPCYATKTSKSLIPTPDYRYYRDQAKEINDLTQKIASLTDWLKLQGFIPAAPSSEGPDAVKKLVERITNADTLLVEVESWAAFTEKGGAGKIIDWLPIQHVIVALKGAMEARAQLVQDVFQITGISDILRGQTDPNETLGAQELKAQTGSRRLKNTRDEIVRFSRDIARLVCEVIAEQFQPETLAAMSGFKYLPSPQPGQIALPGAQVAAAPGGMPPGAPPPMQNMGMMGAGPAPQGAMPGAPLPQQAPGAPMMGHNGGQPMNTDRPESAGVFGDEVVALLRNDRMRSFRIDIETDSTIQPDEDAEKQRRTEFMTAMGGFFNQTREVAATTPQAIPMLGKALSFFVRGFRAGRELEDEIERFTDSMSQQAQMAAQQPKQDPKVVEAQSKAKIDEELAKNTAMIAQQKAAGERQIAQENAASDRAIALLNAQNDMKIKTMMGAQEVVHKERTAKQDIDNVKAKSETEREVTKAKGTDERVQKQLSHADELKHKDEGAKQEREITKGKAESKGAGSVKLSVGDAIGKEVVTAIADGLKPVGPEIGKSIAEALSKVTLKTAPRVTKPKYDKSGNIIETRAEDAA